MDLLHTLTLGDVLRDHARSWPDKAALVDGDVRVTYPQMDERVSRLANALTERGLGPDRRVLWIGQNSHRLMEGLLACAKVGAVFCPVNWRQSPDELAHVLEDAAPAVVLWQDAEIGDTIRKAREQADVEAAWIQHDGDGDGSYEALLAAARPSDPKIAVDPACPVLMMYTAAFGGQPRGALLSHTALIHQAMTIALIQRVDWDYTYLNCGPLFHMATFMTTIATFHLGGTNVFTPRADAEEICRLIQDERCNGAFIMPPTAQQIGEINKDGTYDLSSLVAFRMGVEGFDDAISDESTPWLRRPGGYGQTEVTGLATLTAVGGVGMAGRSAPSAQVRIVDPEHNEVPVGETGEIVVRGPLVMNGYLGDDEETERRQRGGWHHTNDLGRRQEDGTIVFVAPMTKIIKSAAENIYPAEVEGCLNSHPAIRESAVIGVPDPEWGQNVKALVVLDRNADAPPTADDVIAYCRERIASYKKPKVVDFVDALPRTEQGQIDRDALDEQYGGGGYPGETG